MRASSRFDTRGYRMHPPERRLDRLERLERVILAQSHLVQSDLDIDGFAQRVVEHLRELTESEGVTVELVDGEDTVCFHACGAVAPARTVQARTSFTPAVKYVCRPSSS